MPTRTYVKHFSGTTCEPTHDLPPLGAEGLGRGLGAVLGYSRDSVFCLIN